MGSLNFSRIISSLEKCKSKLEEVEKSGIILQNLKSDLNQGLGLLNILVSKWCKIITKTIFELQMQEH